MRLYEMGAVEIMVEGHGDGARLDDGKRGAKRPRVPFFSFLLYILLIFLLCCSFDPPVLNKQKWFVCSQITRRRTSKNCLHVQRYMLF